MIQDSDGSNTIEESGDSDSLLQSVNNVSEDCQQQNLGFQEMQNCAFDLGTFNVHLWNLQNL